MKLWKWRIDIKIKKLANKEKIDFLVRELYKELEACYDIKYECVNMKGFYVHNHFSAREECIEIENLISKEPFKITVKL